MIVVVSYAGEDHADAVQPLLLDHGCTVVRLDLAEFPQRRPLAARWSPTGRTALAGADLDAARVVWWRRVRPFDVAGQPPAHRSFAVSETDSAVLGLLDALPARWVNPRGADEAAHRKPLVWTRAQEVGLDVPDTLVTTDAQAARAFLAEHGLGQVVYKCFLATPDAWRETRLVRRADLDRLADLALAPVIFQEYVPGVDLRVTVVDQDVFAAEIDATATSYPVDMRMVLGEATVRPVELPPDVATRLVRLVRRLGLVFGAADLRRRPDGRHVLLEVNPAGQWLFVEARTGQPITASVAALLAGLDGAATR